MSFLTPTLYIDVVGHLLLLYPHIYIAYMAVWRYTVIMNKKIEKIKKDLDILKDMSIDERVNFINEIKLELHKHSPFKNEPVDCVTWVKNDKVIANDYNPNKVAPPEMQLLEVSIDSDGYTQPIVTYSVDGHNEVIDGFH